MIAAIQLQDQRINATNALDLDTLPGIVVVRSIATNVMEKGILPRTVIQVSVNQIATTVPSQDILLGIALKTLVFATLVKNLATLARIVQIAVELRTQM